MGKRKDKRKAQMELALAPAARASDPVTSQEAARRPRESQRMRVLRVYLTHHDLTDEEAGRHSGVTGAWKRCSELRQLGLIEVHGTTVLAGGVKARLCRITDAGVKALRG